MNYRTLGKSGIRVSEIGFGAWQIGGEFGEMDDAEAVASIRLALEMGVNFIDTAAVYGDGHSEKLIGKALSGRGEKVFIASKVPPKTHKWHEVTRTPISQTFPADWIIQCTEQSLANLGIECLDLQQLHAWSPDYLREDAWRSAFDKLKKQGKIRGTGVSANSWDPYGCVELAASGAVDSIQVIYNIFEQRPAEKLFPTAQKSNVGIIVRVPFEEGLLCGIFGPDVQIDPTDWRSDWLTFERRRQAAPRVEALKAFVQPPVRTLAELALRFCLAHPAVSTVIPGMRKTRHVRANTAVSDAKPLPAATVAKLAEHAFVHGWKYPWDPS